MRDILTEHTARYPQMMPCDAVKLIYQSVFGPGHLIPDPYVALTYLENEFSSLSASPSLQTEEIGGRFSRLYLSQIADLGHEESVRLIWKMFLCSADNIYGSESQFNEKLSALRMLAQAGNMPFTVNELNEYIESYLSGGIRPVSHSERYRHSYAPAYRVIKNEFAVLLPMLSDLKKRGHAVIAIDGFCASGKSTLAASLASLLDANLIHTDDFFLPPEKRTEKRFAEPGGNIDYERFKTEVVDQLEKEVFQHGIFDCSEMSITSSALFHKCNFAVIEGSYSMHPYFGNYADVKIFVETSYEEQINRIRARDGEKYLKMFTERWIPFEQKYESSFNIKQCADYLIET